MIDIELKGVVEDLTNKYVDILNLNLLSESVDKNLRKAYISGLEKIGITLSMNFILEPERFDIIKKFTFENIKGMREDLADNLRKELTQSLINLESVSSMKDRVEKVLDTSINRARMIARTEMNRAENMGHIDGARQSGLKLLKRWNAHLDSRTSPICRALNGKTIPIDEKFVYQGKEYDTPPAHPNCRSVFDIIHDKDNDKKSLSEQLQIELKHKYISREGGPGNYHNYKYPKDITHNSSKQELAALMKSKIKPRDKNIIDRNVAAFKAGNDSKGKHYNEKNNTWSDDRLKLHKKINSAYDKDARKAISKGKPKVIFMAGLPASGKTYMTRKEFSKVDGSNILKQDKQGNKYIVINADDIKEHHLPEYDGGRGATIVHNESSVLAASLIKKYQDAKVNIIVDGTLAKTNKATEQLQIFKDNDYHTSLFFVDAPVEQAIIMSAARYREEGRYVSPDIIIDYELKIMNSVETLKKEFDNYSYIDASMQDSLLQEKFNYAKGG